MQDKSNICSTSMKISETQGNGKMPILVVLCLSQFQLDTSPPGNPGENFFERAYPGHPGNFFCQIPCPGAKNDGEFPGGGAKFAKLEETAPY